MTVGLNASQARAKSSQDMIIFNEVDIIMRAVIAASGNGEYETEVTDGSLMTESTPSAQRIGAVNNPTIQPGDTFIINNHTVTLGTSGTNLNAIIADINDAEIPGVIASKDSNYLVITITLEQTTVWSYEIGAGTANASLGLVAGTYSVSNPDSVSYYNTWQGSSTDRAQVQQMNNVINHFKNLGYKIQRLTNTNTARTFIWHIHW